MRPCPLALMAMAILAPAAASLADVPTIDHQPIDCIVAGRFPRIAACFQPADAIARARVYFRPETTTSWFYVDMRPEAPCLAGVLPRPGRALVHKKIHYYVEGLGADLTPGRTAEIAAEVVESAGECRSALVVAPVSAAGPAGVYPGMPPGFLGAAGVSPLLLGGAAAVAIGAGVAVASGGDSTMGTTPAPTPTTTTPPQTPPPATTPPAEPPRPAAPPLALSCQASPREGDAPLTVSFAAFPTGGAGSYEYFWDFGDGGSSRNPSPSYRYESAGVFNATVRVESGAEAALCARPITVTRPTAVRRTLTVSTIGPKAFVVISSPGSISCSFPSAPSDQCADSYLDGTQVRLTVFNSGAPGPPNIIWSGPCDTVFNTNTSSNCIVVMDADKSITATHP